MRIMILKNEKSDNIIVNDNINTKIGIEFKY